MKLTDPVPSTRIPRPVTRFFALACMVGGGLLLIAGLFFALDAQGVSGPAAFRSLLLSCVMIGFGVAIDRDRIKEENPVAPQPRSHAEAPSRHD